SIAFHKWSAMPRTLEGIIIRDADKLDFLSHERWRSWSRLLKEKGALRIEELSLVSSKIPDLQSILMLNSSLDMLRLEKSKLMQAAAEVSDKRISKLLLLALTP